MVTRLFGAVALVVALLIGAASHAQEASPDEEIARRHYEDGKAAYVRKDYRAAIAAFEEARRVLPQAAFDYNIARCWDRMNEPTRAVEEYRRYLAGAGDDPNASEVRARVEVLQRRVAPMVVTSPPGEVHHRRLIAASTLAAISLAALATGGGLLGHAAQRFSTLQGSCSAMNPCDPAIVDAIRPYDYAGKAMLTLGGALIAVDIGLWIWTARRP